MSGGADGGAGAGEGSRGVTQAQRIAASLETEIVQGGLAPGQRLDEVAIAARYGVSRTPVREAFRMLAASGLVDHEPRIGSIVARPTVSDVIELFELVGELEGSAIRLACERAVEADMARIGAAYHASQAAALGADAGAYLAANDAFHRAIHEAAGNHALSSHIRQLNRRLAPYRRFITFDPARRQSAEREHEGLAAALFARDGQAAAGAMREHIRILAEDSVLLARSLRL